MVLPAIAASLLGAAAAAVHGNGVAHGHVREHAHPADEGYAECEYVAGSGVLEVALSVHALTLDEALGAWIGRDVRLEDPKGEVAVVDYLEQGFRVEARRARPGEPPWSPCSQTFIGYEFEEQSVWLYFEVALPAEPADLRVSFEMLFDLFSTQVNELYASGPSGRSGHVFRWESGWADLSYLLRPPAAPQ